LSGIGFNRGWIGLYDMGSNNPPWNGETITREASGAELREGMGFSTGKDIAEYGTQKKTGTGSNTIWSGNRISVKSHETITFITRTGTNLITVQETSYFSPLFTTNENIQAASLKTTGGGNRAANAEKPSRLAIITKGKTGFPLGVSPVVLNTVYNTRKINPFFASVTILIMSGFAYR
jgi:hypothetical protein